MKLQKYNRKTKARLEKKLDEIKLHEIMNDYYAIAESLKDGDDSDSGGD